MINFCLEQKSEEENTTKNDNFLRMMNFLLLNDWPTEGINPLSDNPTKLSNTLKQFVGVCLTILWDWRLKG